MKILNNNNKYLSSDLIEKCFEPERVNYVDKILTGNGFSHGFSLIKPKRGKVNILIAPNQSVVKDKQKEFETGNFGFPGAKIAFVYEGNGLKGHAKNYDIIVIVSDSFVNFSWKIEGIADKIMVDEYHSAIIQSSFRYKLKQMLYLLSNGFEDASVSFVTASPILYAKTTIKIINSNIDKQILNVTSDQNNSIDRVVDSINSGKTTLLFLQDANIVKKILNKAKRNNFNLMAGTSFTTTLLTKGKYLIDKNSNLIIGSSASMEGWSSYAINGNVFIFMNTANNHTTFLGCNIYQAIGRLRNGFNYAEICVTNLRGGGFANKYIDLINEKIEKFISIDKDPVEKKQSKGYKFYYKGEEIKASSISNYLYYRREKNKFIIEKYEPSILIHNETRQIDQQLNIYKDFFQERNIYLNQIDVDITSKRLISKNKREQKIENIVFSIRENNIQDLLFSFFFKVRPIEKHLEYYINELSMLLEVAYILEIQLDNKYFKLMDFLTVGCYKDELRELFIEAKKEKGESRREISKQLKTFDELEFIYCVEIAVGIVFENFEPYYVGHRDYNKLTFVNKSLIEFISDKLGFKCIEVDIKNCFPRVVYALNGFNLPSNFYDIEGVDRSKQKRLVNIILNSFRFNTEKNRTKERQLIDARHNLKKVNFNDETINYLIENFFLSPYKSDFFNFIAYHEKRIIKSLIELIKSYNLNAECFIQRRHDSVLIFTDNDLNLNNLYEFNYLSVSGWFNAYENDNNEDLFLRDIY